MNEKEKKTTKINDWMVRIAFAEAGEPDMGFEATGSKIERKTKLALDKIMVVRSERMSTETEGKDNMVSTGEKGPTEPLGESLRVMVLDDEPIVGKRLRQALTKHGFEVEVFEDPANAISRLGEAHFVGSSKTSTSKPCLVRAWRRRFPTIGSSSRTMTRRLSPWGRSGTSSPVGTIVSFPSVSVDIFSDLPP